MTDQSADEDKQLPCDGCGLDLASVETEDTTATVDAKSNPHFSGDSVKEVPAWICPECGEVTPL